MVKKMKVGIFRRRYNDEVMANLAAAKFAESDMAYRRLKSKREEMWGQAKEYQLNGKIDEAKKLLPIISGLDSKMKGLERRKQVYMTIETLGRLESNFAGQESIKEDKALVDYSKKKSEQIKDRNIYGADQVTELSTVERDLLGAQEINESIGQNYQGYTPDSQIVDDLYKTLESEVQTSKTSAKNKMSQLEQAVAEATA